MKRETNERPLPDRLHRFEPSSYLQTPEDIWFYAAAAAEDPTTFESQQDAVATMAKALGMQMMSRATGIPYEDLDKALHTGDRSVANERTIAKVIETYRQLGDQAAVADRAIRQPRI